MHVDGRMPLDQPAAAVEIALRELRRAGPRWRPTTSRVQHCERLAKLSDASGATPKEGARRDEHPMITFRDGPTIGRAGVIGGPDAREVVTWLDDPGSSEDRADTVAGEAR